MEEEIDLFDLLLSFWKKIFWIILAVVFGALIGIIYTRFIVVPKYSSNVTLILSKASSNIVSSPTYIDSEEAITQSDITLNQKLISTYAEIMKSRRVCEEIKSNLNLDMNYDTLKEAISVATVKDTDVIKVTVTTKDAELSKKIVTELVNSFTKEVDRIYNIQNVSILDEALADDKPVNISYTKNTIIFALIGGILVCGVIFLQYYFDNTIKSQDTVTKITGLPVLATIPKMDPNSISDAGYSSETRGDKRHGK